MVTISDYRNSKSRCLKRVWLEKNNESVLDNKNNERLEESILIKELGRKLRPNGTLINYNNNIDLMVHQTNTIMSNDKIIYNAIFKYDDICIKCDILEYENEKWDIYLIKSSVNVEKKYYDELAIQYYVLQNLGYKVGNINIAYINNEYIRENELDINELFNIENVTDTVVELANEVNDNIILIKDTIKENIEPNVELGEYCLKENGGKKASDCECRKHCFRNIPQNSIFDINGMYLKSPKKFKLYKDGIIEFKDLVKGKYLGTNAKIQVECELNDSKIINREEISKFIDKLEYPLYFLDFETFDTAIPPYKGIKPYQQIPFQYSIHYKETDESDLKHFEYLAKEGVSSTREFAERLIGDLGQEGSIVVYNKSFECSRIKELSNMYEELNEDLLKLNERVVDLMDIFSKRFYYQKEMKGSYSIKYVLPALFPNDEELDYERLNIKNGSMAMNTFPTLHLKNTSEIKQIREDLLKYCCLDTLAMVRILEKLEKECAYIENK